MSHWVSKVFAVRVDDEGAVLHIHPIPFDDHREADRAVARLNAEYDRNVSELGV